MAQENKIRFGIFHKLLLIMLIVAMVPLGVIWFVDSRATTQRITQNVETHIKHVSDALVDHVNQWVDMNYRVLKQNAALPQIISMDANQQNAILRIIADEYNWAYLVFTIAPSGLNIGRSDDKSPKKYGDRIYVKQVLAGQKMGQQVIIGRTSGKPSFVLSAPIHNPKKQLIGVMAIAMTIAEISERITNIKIGETGYAFLLDETGQVIAHQSEEFTLTRKDLSGHPAFKALTFQGQSDIVFTDENGDRTIAAMQKTKHGWIMVTQQSYNEAFAAIRLANRNALILIAVTLVFVIIIAYFISQRLAKPIRRLTAIADEISLGKLDAKIVDMDRKDEIGNLARAISRLGVSVRLAMERLQRK